MCVCVWDYVSISVTVSLCMCFSDLASSSSRLGLCLASWGCVSIYAMAGCCDLMIPILGYYYYYYSCEWLPVRSAVWLLGKNPQVCCSSASGAFLPLVIVTINIYGGLRMFGLWASAGYLILCNPPNLWRLLSSSFYREGIERSESQPVSVVGSCTSVCLVILSGQWMNGKTARLDIIVKCSAES